MNAKISVFVICVEAIIYWLLFNLHDSTFKIWALLTEMALSRNHQIISFDLYNVYNVLDA